MASSTHHGLELLDAGTNSYPVFQPLPENELHRAALRSATHFQLHRPGWSRNVPPSRGRKSYDRQSETGLGPAHNVRSRVRTAHKDNSADSASARNRRARIAAAA